MESVSKQVERLVACSAPGSFLRASALESMGSRAAVETALSRLARRGLLERVERGIYWRGVSTRFGMTRPHWLGVALELTRHRAGGPTGATAAYLLALSTQVPPCAEIAVVGARPAGRASRNIRYVMRNNGLRVGLTPEEIALLELAREGFSRVELDESAFRDRLTELVRENRLNPERLAAAVIREPFAAREALRNLPVTVLAA